MSWSPGHRSYKITLQWRHNGRNIVSNQQPHDCLLNRLFRRRSKKTSKLRVTGLCAGNSPVTDEFLAQIASDAEDAPIWWRHHEIHWLRASRYHCGIFGINKYTFAIIVSLHRILPLHVYNMLIMSKQKYFQWTKSRHIYSTGLLYLFLYLWICAILQFHSLGSKKTSNDKIPRVLEDAINKLLCSLSDCYRMQ